MRHVLAARTVAAGSFGMGEAPAATGLVARPRGSLAEPPCAQGAVTGAIDMAAVAAAADQHLHPTARAKEQPR